MASATVNLEGAVARQIVEVARHTQQQGVADGVLEMTMGPLDAAVLMGEAALLRLGVMA